MSKKTEILKDWNLWPLSQDLCQGRWISFCLSVSSCASWLTPCRPQAECLTLHRMETLQLFHPD